MYKEQLLENYRGAKIYDCNGKYIRITYMGEVMLVENKTGNYREARSWSSLEEAKKWIDSQLDD